MRVLSLDGGGYLGLATAAFLDGAEEHFSSRCADRFDLFCGTSTGAIIALALAYGLPAREIVQLYRRLGETVFPGWRASRLWKLFPGAIVAQYRSKPLREALERVFGEATLGELWGRRKAALITAFCTTTGTPRVFKTNHSDNLTAHGGYRLADIALASAAAPTYFPLVELRDPLTGVIERFCDGGVFANTPSVLGYAEAVGEFRAPASDIKLLSVSTPRMDLSERPGTRRGRRSKNRGWWRWKESIFDITFDGTSTVSVGALQRIMRASGAQHCRVDLPNTGFFKFDESSRSVSEALYGIGTTAARLTPIRLQLESFFRD